jgi:hypothetical protein
MQGPDDWEEFYTVPNVPTDLTVEKQYYLVITLSGYGVLAVVAMKSGSKNINQPEDMSYWMHELVQRKLADERTQEMLINKQWSVRCSSHMAAST